MTQVQLLGNAFLWSSGFTVDGDGAPNCYAPYPLDGLDYIANAGGPGNWFGIVTNTMGEPIIQAAGDPYPGFYISQTSLVDRSKSANDPARYVDARIVPYIAVPRDLRQRGVILGDLAMVLYGDKQSAAIVADVSPHYGEGSIALAERLGIPSSPKHGGCGTGVCWIVFPKTATGWPREQNEIDQSALLAFELWGGEDKLRAALVVGSAKHL